MTDASTIVATIENRPTRAVPEASGNTRRPGDKAKEAAKTEGKTFADSLKDAQSRQEGKSEKSLKPVKARQAKKTARGQAAAGSSRRRVQAGTTGIPGAESGKAGLAKSLNAAESGIETTDVREAEAADLLDAAAVQDSGAPEEQGVLAQAGNTALPQTGNRTIPNRRSGRSDSGGGTEAVSAKRTVKDVIDDAGIKNADLSSRSGRVEVVDNREFAKVEGKITSGSGAKTGAAAVKARGDAAARSDASPTAVARNEGFAVAESEIDISPASGRESAGRSAAAELAKKLDGEAGGDIVRQVKVILNRSDAGEVRINLRPDNLGRVRVRIQLEDNRLTGRIYVESAAAREAFRDAISGLQSKLVEAGFGAADLELAWDESAQDFADGGSQNRQKSADSGHSAREFENTVPVTIVDEAADGRVNLVV